MPGAGLERLIRIRHQHPKLAQSVRTRVGCETTFILSGLLPKTTLSGQSNQYTSVLVRAHLAEDPNTCARVVLDGVA